MQKIAVIGISCLFPGAHTPEQFLHNLNQQVDSTMFHTKDQMGVEPSLYYSDKKGRPDKYYSKRGGYITGFEFDARGFGIDEKVLEQLDDIYKWSLYVSREALKDGGILEDSNKRRGCGIILGNLSFPTKQSNRLYLPIYQKAIEASLQELLADEALKLQDDFSKTGSNIDNSRISGYPASVVAKALGLSETCLSLDAACASSLYSVKLACDYLNSGRSDLMLAGAVSAGDPFFINQGFSTFTAYSENDISCPLDKRSEGLVSGEGAGMLLLKRYQDAVKDGDTIHAVISAIGLSNDGKGRSVLSPNKKGQILAFERAYKNAEVNPKQIDYIECHATGTHLGDITELESLEDFFGKHQASPLIGAVKANFGHLLTCAGMASMLKVILSMSQARIPATIHVEQPISSPNGVISPEHVVTQSKPWPQRSPVKYGAVNAFGFGGTNAHLVFEEPVAKPADTSKEKGKKLPSLAIVGMEASFGPYQNLSAFDNAIFTGQQGFGSLPKNRWKGVENISSLLNQYGFDDGLIPTGAYLSQFDFDMMRYKIPPNEIDSMMPQQLLMLKVADEAIKDAGLREGSNVGVIVAIESDKSLHQFRGRIDLDWMAHKALDRASSPLTELEKAELTDNLKNAIRNPVQVNEFTSFIGNITASRVSALWDFTGLSFTVSAEDNSVYKALQLAQLLLENEEVDAVVVGAVDLAGHLEDVLIRNRYYSSYAKGEVSIGLEASTQGFKLGEGAGAVVLKTREKAEKENSRIYASVESIDIQSELDAKTVSQGFKRICSDAGVVMDDVEMLEISGVGHDEKILTGFVSAFENSTEATCALGSVTGNIGHTYVASGIASLIKTALCLYHSYIPSVPNWENPKTTEKSINQGLYAPTESRFWTGHEDGKRIAVIAGIGSDESIAQLLLTEDTTPRKRENSSIEHQKSLLFAVVGNSKESLIENLNALAQGISSADDLYGFACHHNAGSNLSSATQYRAVIIGDSKDRLNTEIRSAIEQIPQAYAKGGEWQSPMGSYFTADPLANGNNLAFVYPGAFNSYIGMGRETFRLFPDLVNLLKSYSDNPNQILHHHLLYPRSIKGLSDTDLESLQKELEQNVIPTFETGIGFAILKTAMLQGAFGIQPNTAFGYSMGEVSMGFSLGLWSSTDRMSQTLHNTPLFKERLAGPMQTLREAWNISPTNKDSIWSCFVIRRPATELFDLLKEEKRVFLLLINSPNEVIIGGEKEACKSFIEKHSLAAAPSSLEDVIHCPLVEKERQAIVEMQHSPVTPNNAIRFYSASGYDETSQSSQVLAENIANIYCKTLDFLKLVDKVYQDGIRIFLEVGPKSNCSRWIDEILAEKNHLAISIDGKGTSEYVSLLKALAKLYSHGVKLDFSYLYPPQRALNKVSGKTYTIRPGGKSIRDSIVTPANIEKYRKKSKPEPVKSPPIAHKLETQVTKDEYRVPELINDPATPDQLFRMEQEVLRYHSQVSRNHSAFLTARDASLKHLREMIKLQIMLASGNPVAVIEPEQSKPFKGDPYFYPETRKFSAGGSPIWNEQDLLEFAGGKISAVFGEEYSIIDTYKYRVRLPLPPYLLVNRVTQLDAVRGEYKPSSLTTEYDVAEDAWFCVDGQIPWAIASEAGQCDLLLISYLGIDFDSKGERYYRLTDYTMTFYDDLPKAGATLRYHIKIDSFIRSGAALFFNFGYDCFVGDKLVYKMTGGRAGFISDEELAQGKGVVLSRAEIGQRNSITKRQFTPLLNCNRTQFSREDLLNITNGKIAACFGADYDQNGLNPSLRFASQEILMLDRIVSVEKNGGPWGLGEVIAEKDLAPDHWYFPCHFKDDNVLAGTLVTEGCVQLLGFYMLYLGLQVKTADARFQPIKNRSYGIRARGQIVPTDTKYVYKMEIIDIGLEPHPYARANFYIIKDGKTLVDFRDLGVELLEKTPDDPAFKGLNRNLILSRPQPLYGPEVIEEFATGSLAKVFGPEFQIYDNRRGPRTPNGDLKLVSRIMELKGERHNFKIPSELTAEYDVPADVWFLEQNSYPIAPYSIIMEIALQPCAFLSAYMGTTLVYPQSEMCFRNLGSTAELLYTPDVRGKTIVDKITMTSVSRAAETVILTFTYELSCEGSVFYKGDTQFGYYTPKALSVQKGLDRGEKAPPWFLLNGLSLDSTTTIDLHSAKARERYFAIDPQKPHYRLAGNQLEFLDDVSFFPNQGKFRKGYIFAHKAVNSSDWFYPCHFYGDPVMPGSLGVEAILQAMKAFVLHQRIGESFRSPRFVHVPGITRWKYRGQITPDNQDMDLEVHIKSIDQYSDQIILKADANLWKNKIRIYEITDVAIALAGENG